MEQTFAKFEEADNYVDISGTSGLLSWISKQRNICTLQHAEKQTFANKHLPISFKEDCQTVCGHLFVAVPYHVCMCEFDRSLFFALKPTF